MCYSYTFIFAPLIVGCGTHNWCEMNSKSTIQVKIHMLWLVLVCGNLMIVSQICVLIIWSSWKFRSTMGYEFTLVQKKHEHEIKHQVTKLVLVQDSHHKNFEQYANFKCSPA